jgi:hypothetical protein
MAIWYSIKQFIMAEQEKQDINTPIEERIKATKGTKIGDDLVNPLERKLYDDLVTEHGNVMSDTKETMNKEFLSLIEDVGDISEGNQRQLREVAEMLGVTLTTKDGGLQMNYELFQKILKFQKEHEMKLTGIVDDTLYQALKKHTEEEKKADTPATPAEAEKKTDTPNATPAEEKKDTPYTGLAPEKTEKTREETIQSIAEKPFINDDSAYPVGPQTTEAAPVVTPIANWNTYAGDNERILPPSVPVGIAQNAGQNIGNINPTISPTEWEKTPVVEAPAPVETAAPTIPKVTTPNAPETPPAPEKPKVVALPVEEAAEKTAEVETILNEEAKKLWITSDDINYAQSPAGQEIVNMVLYYEWGDVGRTEDTVGYDLGWGINDRAKELRYALWGENDWIKTWIPSEKLIRQSVERMLHARIAVTKKSCADKQVPFDTLPQNVKAVLVDLHYNMPNNINEFTEFWTAIKENRWADAGRELLENESGTGPSLYAIQTEGRAYANARMLANEDTNYREYKQEGEKIGGGAALLSAFNSRGSKTVTKQEVKEGLETIKTAADLVAITTSADVLSSKRMLSDKGSTNAIIELINGFKIKNPAEAERLKGMLEAKIGNYSRPLKTREEVGAFQQLFYLTYPERFASEMEYIDGIYGDKTEAIFMKDIFVMWGWQEKMEGSNGMLNKSPAEIATYISSLGEFERDILKRHYTGINVNENSSKNDIVKAQLGLALSGVDIPVDGVWNQKTRELLEYPELAKSLGDFVENNYASYGGGAFSCGASVGRMLSDGFGIQGLPQSERHGTNWEGFLDARPDQFTKIKINSPDDARPGGILCYNGGGGGSRSYMAKKFGHVEITGSNGNYVYYKKSKHWGGSAGANLENSQFTGYVYYPRRLEA